MRHDAKIEPRPRVEKLRGPDPTYGSDLHGMVWGYRLAPDRPASEITSEGAVEFLASPPTGGEFLWLHFSLANTSSEPWLRKHLELPESFYETFRGDVGSTRLEQGADFLVALIHDVLFDFKFDAAAIATASLFVNP